MLFKHVFNVFKHIFRLFTSPASGSEVLQLVCLFVCHTMYIMYWKYLMYTLHQLVAN